MTTESTLMPTAKPDKKSIGFFERWLTIWVFLCIAIGIILGQLLPGPVKFIGSLEIARVNIPVGLLLGLSSITVPWDTLLISVGLYIVIPVLIAQAWRRALLRHGQATFDKTLALLHPVSLCALLTTLVLLFGFQGEAILKQPLVIAMLAVPILIQVFFNSSVAYLLNRKLGVAHSVACPSALIGASNFFELAVATAISLFGFNSGAALATVVGVLIEVPVMLAVVKIVNGSKDWYQAGSRSGPAIQNG